MVHEEKGLEQPISNRKAGYIDPLINLAKIQHESENEGTRASAAAALLGYIHPKLQSSPVHVTSTIHSKSLSSNDRSREEFPRQYSQRVSRPVNLISTLQIPSPRSTVAWLQPQFAKQGIDLKAQAQGASDRDTTIQIIEGGLPHSQALTSRCRPVTNQRSSVATSYLPDRPP